MFLGDKNLEGIKERIGKMGNSVILSGKKLEWLFIDGSFGEDGWSVGVVFLVEVEDDGMIRIVVSFSFYF